jgi:hypothetical protein
MTSFEQDLGDDSSSNFTITHKLGTRAVHVVVYKAASPWDEVDVAIEHTDPNTVTVRTDGEPMTTNAYHVVVSKV